MKIKIYKRIVALVLAGASLSLLPSCIKDDNVEETFSTNTILTVFNGETVLDELLSDENREVVGKIIYEDDLLDEVNKLEDYLKKSEELNSLKLENYNIYLDSIEVEQLDNFDDYDNAIKQYRELNAKINNKTILNDDNIQLYKLVNKLKQYETKANNWLLTDGYKIAENYGKLAIKSLVMEANNMTDINDLNRITIEPVPDWHNSIKIDQGTKDELTLEFKSTSLENRIICKIIECQENQNKNAPLDGKYNEKRNDILSEIINDVKLTIPNDYIINGDVIKPTTSTKNVRNIIEQRIK